MERRHGDLRDVTEAAGALQDSLAALVALERNELQLARAQVFGETRADIEGDEQARARAALNDVIAELRTAQADATTDRAIASLSHVIAGLHAATAYAATAQAIASLRRAINALRWLAGEGETGELARGFVIGRAPQRGH